jgi:predicted transcriptional regulator
MSRRLSSEKIKLLRKEILSEKSDYQVARELGISESTVRNHTKDIAKPKNVGPCIKKEQFELFKKLLEDGYRYIRNKEKKHVTHTRTKVYSSRKRLQKFFFSNISMV